MRGLRQAVRLILSVAVLATAICLLPAVHIASQSLKATEPSHLQPGANRGTLDSLAGPQYWDVTVNPGKFRLVFSGGGPQEGFPPGRVPHVSLEFLPKPAGGTFSQRGIALDGTVFSGTVTERTQLRVTVTPVRSPERQMIDYTLVVSGDVDFC